MKCKHTTELAPITGAHISRLGLYITTNTALLPTVTTFTFKQRYSHTDQQQKGRIIFTYVCMGWAKKR